jgi:cytidine deaminase
VTPYELDAAQIALVLDALEVAAEYLRYRADHAPCGACYRAPAEFCDDHTTDLKRAAGYDDLASQIHEPAS